MGAMTPPRVRSVTARRSGQGRTDLQLETCRFNAMGTQVELLAVNPPGDSLASARARLADLERRWSRFLPGSETNALNRARGGPVAVSSETFTLVTLAFLGWRASGGRFDPTVLDALERAGYDRSFEQLGADSAAAQAGCATPAPGLDGVVLDDEAGTITLPAGRRFDPGGIAKGYAADLVCAELLVGGAAGACVNIGGDLLVRGVSPHGGPWTVAVPHPAGGSAATLELPNGAVATSSPLRRAWGPAGRPVHHLIDPRSGRPADTGILQVSVVTHEAWWAEVAAKTTYLAGLEGALEVAAGLGAEALAVGQDGRMHVTAGLERAGWTG
jgi:thiamine biosynthesis lipoprotein